MANLDVALRLRLINGLKGPSQEAKRDLDSLRTSAQRLNSTRGGDALARDLGRVVTAGGRADASLRQVAANRSALSATGTAAARLGTSLTGVVTAGSQADTSIRKLGSGRAGIAGLDAVAKALSQDLDRAGSAATKTAAGLGRLGSERARIAGTAAVAAELARNLERAASVVPRIRLPDKPVRPWGEPGAEPVRRSAGRPSGPLMQPPPETKRKGAGEGAESGSTIVGIGSTALKAAGGIYVARTAIRSTVGEAISFEKAWAEVVKKVNDAPNPEAMQQLQRTVARTAIDLGMSRNGLAELTAEAGAAGIKFADLERYVKLAAKASVGWDMTPREASQKLAEIKTAGSYTIAEMDVLADKINALGDNSAAKESDIVEMMQRAAAPAKAAGVDADTSLASLTALRSSGMQAEIAARFFGAFTSKLATAEKDGKKGKGIQEAFEAIGLTIEKVTAGMKRDAGGTMIDILDRLAKHAEPAKVAKKLMGAEWWDELARFSQAAPEVRKQLDFLKNPANFKGSLGNNLGVQLSTTENHLKRLVALMGDLGDRAGRVMLPGINDAVQKTIGLFDSIERRTKLANDLKTQEEKEDSTGRFVTKTFEVAKDLGGKGLDLAFGQEPTADPARQSIGRASQEVRDAREAATKALAEAATLEARAKSTKDKTVSGPLMAQAAKARADAAAQTEAAQAKNRTIGPLGARDMTDVEFGEAAARKSIETTRRLKAIEAGLAGGNQRNIRLPGTGVVMSRTAGEAELVELRATMKSLTAGADKVTTVRPPKFGLSGPTGQADMKIGRQPGAATSFPLSADLAAPKFDAQPIITAVKQAEDATKGLQTTLKQDLSGPATESMESYKGALSTGVQAAVALVVAAAAQMKAALSFNATPTITPSISAPRAAPAGGGGAPATASPARATGGTSGGAAPRLQSAGLRQRGGSTFTGPIHVHGVRDVASLERGIRREGDRQARDSRDNGLHDLGATV